MNEAVPKLTKKGKRLLRVLVQSGVLKSTTDDSEIIKFGVRLGLGDQLVRHQRENIPATWGVFDEATMDYVFIRYFASDCDSGFVSVRMPKSKIGIQEMAVLAAVLSLDVSQLRVISLQGNQN